MPEFAAHLWLGLTVAAAPTNLAFCCVGALLGTIVGILPGIGAVATVAMLLPMTFGLPPSGALIMLAGIYYGAQYGGSTTAILFNIPGEPTAIPSALDGHQLARRGRAGPALFIAALGSFVGGTVATFLVAALAAPLALAALLFGPMEYVSLMVLGLIMAVMMAPTPMLNGAAAVLCGLLLSTVGLDLESGLPRMTLGVGGLETGIGFVSLATGLFGFAEILRILRDRPVPTPETGPTGRPIPSRADLREAAPAIGRGTAVGAVVGLLPGSGALTASFAAYALEKAISRDPARFGRGSPRGLAAAESANNAAAQTSFIPMLSLGIPPNAIMAMMIGALALHGIVPGPRIVAEQPELFWGLIASMWIGNVLLLVLNLPLVGLWIRLLRAPRHLLYPAILVFCCVGILGVRGSALDVVAAAAFGVAGDWMRRHDLPSGPLLLAFVLGPMLEDNLRRAVIVARGEIANVADRPLSVILLALAAGLLVAAAFRR
ncbi:tripartite tricarboxylate transporter permease [Amaricoccus solimangrovi]|uniref:Tripartite tricarboxylate transporter permease n=1 Tax=Amaricoccus solimangrovi TaxID=2589815 RepID=A0A501WM42_9RHOB|nr:tripartite tricarboxylate transporter permease [Amaricoccus solimangrovi]TPE48081.1 tripartite tricarboxylate transporter permease [Amaricoccus solimangrovi]